jgi:hypothetical protein
MIYIAGHAEGLIVDEMELQPGNPGISRCFNLLGEEVVQLAGAEGFACGRKA